MNEVSLQGVQFLNLNFVNEVNVVHPEVNSRRYIIKVGNVCPYCNLGIDMTSSAYINYSDMMSADQQRFNILSIYRCPICNRGFFVEHHMISRVASPGPYSDGTEYVEYSQFVFPTTINGDNTVTYDDIRNISPRFYDVYTQCLKAKNSGLSELYGMGFRKALEILVKDFAIFEKLDERCNIESASLHDCIEKYFKDSDAKTGLLACKWLGNNETHYVNPNDKDDLQLLSDLIEDTLYYIHRELRKQRAVQVNNNKGRKSM